MAAPLEKVWSAKLNKRSDMFQKLCSGTLKQLQIEMMPLAAFCMKEDSVFVTSELERLQRNKEKADEEDRASFPSWPHKHQEAFTAAGIRLSKAKPPGRLGESPWYHELPDRERDIGYSPPSAAMPQDRLCKQIAANPSHAWPSTGRRT